MRAASRLKSTAARILVSQHRILVSQHRHAPVRAGAAAALALTLVSPASAAQVSQPAGTTEAVAAAEVRAEAAWIRMAQLADGAIETGPGFGTIAPYGANYAALGLATAASDLRDHADADAAWRWLAWYQAHQ